MERTLAWLQKCRALLVRYDKKAKLDELKEGDPANVTINDGFVVTKIEANVAAISEYVLTVEGMS